MHVFASFYTFTDSSMFNLCSWIELRWSKDQTDFCEKLTESILGPGPFFLYNTNAVFRDATCFTAK